MKVDLKKTAVNIFYFLATIGFIDMAIQAFTSGKFKLIQSILSAIFKR